MHVCRIPQHTWFTLQQLIVAIQIPNSIFFHVDLSLSNEILVSLPRPKDKSPISFIFLDFAKASTNSTQTANSYFLHDGSQTMNFFLETVPNSEQIIIFNNNLGNPEFFGHSTFFRLLSHASMPWFPSLTGPPGSHQKAPYSLEDPSHRNHPRCCHWSRYWAPWNVSFFGTALDFHFWGFYRFLVH